SPFLGAAIGAGAGALAGKMSSVGSESLTGQLNDIGLNNEFIQRITNAIHPSEAALFLLTRDEVATKVLPELKQYQFEVIQTSLSDANEAQLHEMLG
ncbi:MAG TPA: DUF1269 domain-containing protein, partial [Ktedonobacteraceae bacterium]|nr:DUF1269 domain-containing protein [Ktedonobacteraceae bacterium]